MSGEETAMQHAAIAAGPAAPARRWHVFAVAVAPPPMPPGPPSPSPPPWSRISGGWQLELVDRPGIVSDELARRLLGLAADAPMLTHDDPACGVYRAAAFIDDRLAGALLADVRPLAIRRDWLAARLGTTLDPAEQFRLLDGRPDGAMTPRGRTVCFCRDVRFGQIADAVAAGADTLRAVAAATTAGTNCGCCRADLARILREARSGASSPGD